MSKWRQKGFVQDSDEDEEESQLDSQNARLKWKSNERVARVDETSRSTTPPVDGDIDDQVFLQNTDGVSEDITVLQFESTPRSQHGYHPTPSRNPSIRRPTASPLTPVARAETSPRFSESPDPIQGSITSITQQVNLIQQSEKLRSQKSQVQDNSPEAHQSAENFAAGSQIQSTKLSSPITKVSRLNGPSTILREFGIHPLSDSSDDTLSDPPTDIESPGVPYYTSQPHRRTAVQIVIPSSTALQRRLQEQESRREFRQRKPIQLHPYALEGELYRREVQSRGLKPVPRPRSPERRIRQRDDETQEQDFDPEKSPSSSPHEPEVPVATPSTRKEGSRVSSEPRPGIHSGKRRVSSTQARHQHHVKRRRLNTSPGEGIGPLGKPADHMGALHDIWSLPPNSPPYSSSPALPNISNVGPTLGLVQGGPATSLPTPSTSSVLHDGRQFHSDSESEAVSQSVPRSTGKSRRPNRTIFSEEPSDASSSDSEQSEVENELKKVGKRMKGVLPASWLRFDRQSQHRRQLLQKEQQRVHEQSGASPGVQEPQRGVAKRIVKQVGNYSRGPSLPQHEVGSAILISDGSDADLPSPNVSRNGQDWQRLTEEAVSEARAIDTRYGQDDSDDMENDRLHLFTLGGSKTKRKKQTKLPNNSVTTEKTDAHGTKRQKIRPRVKGTKQSMFRGKPRATPPPALSVVDVEMTANMPQFLRVARRQALRRPDLARQSPRRKAIHLQSIGDTEDAQVTLRRWRQGSMKPVNEVVHKKNPAKRSPLSEVVRNQQRPSQLRQMQQDQPQDVDASTKAHVQASTQRKTGTNPTLLQLFKRASRPSTQHNRLHTKSHDSKSSLQASSRRQPPRFRSAQLEEEEKSFGRDHRRMAFEKGLRRVEHQQVPTTSNQGPYMNPQLARYLADDDGQPTPPAAVNIPKAASVEDLDSRRKPARIRRKAPAQRIDIDTREYRQPSEPAVLEVLNVVDMENVVSGDNPFEDTIVLQGLGPFGTQYPTTFDIMSFPSDMYFHSSTIVGSAELQRALSISQHESRDLDSFAGYCTISHGETIIRCGPWNDETSSLLQSLITEIIAPLDAFQSEDLGGAETAVLQNASRFLRSLVNYVSDYLSFLDSIDRRSFVARIQQLLQTVGSKITIAAGSKEDIWHESMNVYTYSLLLGTQTDLIAQHEAVCNDSRHACLDLKRRFAKDIITSILQTGMSDISQFLENSKRHTVRQNGIQESEVVAQSIVVCLHAMEHEHSAGHGFWDILSGELSLKMTDAIHVHDFESTWASIFTLLPFVEFDITGIPSRSRRELFSGDNWACISTMLKRLFDLYPATYNRQGGSVNDYVRAVLARCHRLIKHWHWQQPEQMLNATFDFFGKNGLRPLRREGKDGSLLLLDDLTNEQPLILETNESSFHIALKSLALGLRGMREALTEKKIRSFVFRTIPNHGRTYPKDQPLDAENLAALRNHHDLLCILYWAAPPMCRPKLDLLRSLVSHEKSHREACRINVRSLTNLAAFQMATDEPYTSLKPFALWHKDVMEQTLKQYSLAKTEAEDYLKSLEMSTSADVSTKMVRQAMAKNQEQVIATLRDCIAGVRKALLHAKDENISYTFLEECGTMNLLELPHLEDYRLISVIRDTLKLLREVFLMQTKEPSLVLEQESNEESQDYGDFPSLDDLDDDDDGPAQSITLKPSLDFIQLPLWHLLSNAFGAETMPDDDLLMDCVDTWVLLADHKVVTGERSWAYYLESFSQASWQQLRRTEQTQKFSSYFLAALVDRNKRAFTEHRNEIITSLLVSLADRESTLRFQHRLLHAVLRVGLDDPLLVNLPFFHDDQRGEWDVNADTFRSRRLALISSILCNMRDGIQRLAVEATETMSELKRTYALMLKEFMLRMKSNYQQLQQGSRVAGAYVEFVQKIVQFLKQYTSDICPVLPFFTDSVAFPLPTNDPTYVVGRLCGYAPKARDLGNAKQLSVFIGTVAQQAAVDGQQTYLVDQLTSALCSSETPAKDRAKLQTVLLQGIFPVYIEASFSSHIGFLIAQPILQALQSILDTTMFNLRVMDEENLSTALESSIAVCHAYIRGVHQLISAGDGDKYNQLHVLCALTHMMQAVSSCFTLVDYICGRTMRGYDFASLPLITHVRELVSYITAYISDDLLSRIPQYTAANTTTPGLNTALLQFCKSGLDESIKTNWDEKDGTIRFGRGHAQRVVTVKTRDAVAEKARLFGAIAALGSMLRALGRDGSADLYASMGDEQVFV